MVPLDEAGMYVCSCICSPKYWETTEGWWDFGISEGGGGLTEGPQSLVQPSLMGISSTVTLGASFRYSLATSADCTISTQKVRIAKNTVSGLSVRVG